MSKIKESALELIGGTPIMKLNGYAKKAGVTDAVILAKLEYLNPAGSVKDRVALSMIRGRRRKRHLKTGSYDHRANQRKYRNRTCSRSCSQGIPCDLYAAGYHERRAQKPVKSIRCRAGSD